MKNVCQEETEGGSGQGERQEAYGSLGQMDMSPVRNCDTPLTATDLNTVMEMPFALTGTDSGARTHTGQDSTRVQHGPKQ